MRGKSGLQANRVPAELLSNVGGGNPMESATENNRHFLKQRW